MTLNQVINPGEKTVFGYATSQLNSQTGPLSAPFCRSERDVGLGQRGLKMSFTSRSSNGLASDGLPTSGFVRLANILAPKGPLPISKSSWWDGVREQRYPQPVKLGPRITAWRCEDIRDLMQRGV